MADFILKNGLAPYVENPEEIEEINWNTLTLLDNFFYFSQWSCLSWWLLWNSCLWVAFIVCILNLIWFSQWKENKVDCKHKYLPVKLKYSSHFGGIREMIYFLKLKIILLTGTFPDVLPEMSMQIASYL